MTINPDIKNAVTLVSGLARTSSAEPKACAIA
jgi:hypothetical protein